MLAFVIRRLVYLGMVVVFVSVIIFAATHVLPGSAANLILGEDASPGDILVLERKLGLDRPLYEQYLNWMGNILQGDWGKSLITSQPVGALVGERLANSAVLASLTLAIVVLVAIPLGVFSAVRQGSALDSVILTISYIGISVPEFVIGTILILTLAGPSLAWFPSGGYAPLSDGVGEWTSHLILPVATLTLILIAHVVRQTRAGMIDVLGSNYVRTAILKGAKYSYVVRRHALRNGLLPAITVIAMDVGYLIGSMVIVEEVFAFPGLGQLIVTAVQNRDFPVLEMSILIVAAIYTLSNLAADLIYTFLDPRIRY